MNKQLRVEETVKLGLSMKDLRVTAEVVSPRTDSRNEAEVRIPRKLHSWRLQKPRFYSDSE